MIRSGEDDLICDLAETYRIYNYEEFPPLKLAVYAIGLRNNSRIKTKMAGLTIPLDTWLQAMTVDSLQSVIFLYQAAHSKKKPKKPESITKLLSGKKESNLEAFQDEQDLLDAWKRITEGGP